MLRWALNILVTQDRRVEERAYFVQKLTPLVERDRATEAVEPEAGGKVIEFKGRD